MGFSRNAAARISPSTEKAMSFQVGNNLPVIGSAAMIKEFDPVVLTESRPEDGLEAGDVGWIVMIHANGAGFEVEFVAQGDETTSVATVPANYVRALSAKEISCVRTLA